MTNEFKKYNENMKDLQKQILELLKENSNRFLLGDIIVTTIGLKNKVQLRGLINKLRKKGIPIIATSNGYKYTEDVEEIMAYIESLQARVNDMKLAYRGLELYLIERRYNEKN